MAIKYPWERLDWQEFSRLTMTKPVTFEYLNNVVEQDHRAVKRITRPMLGFKSFEAAQYTLAGVKLMHMLRKGQLEGEVDQGLTAAQQFYSLAA